MERVAKPYLLMVSPMDVQTRGFLWMKFMVPSMGSMIQVGLSTKFSTIPEGVVEMSSSPMKQ